MAQTLIYRFEGKLLTITQIAKRFPAYSRTTISRWLAEGARSGEDFRRMEREADMRRRASYTKLGRNPFSRPFVVPSSGAVLPFRM